MTAAIILLLAMAVLGVAVAMFSRLRGGNDGDVVQTANGCATCDGSNERCEQECMMEAATKPIEYYDDEELDCYAGRSGDAYTDDEAEQFREILYTMKPEEATGWSRSLTLRGIVPPDQIKDELLLMIKG